MSGEDPRAVLRALEQRARRRFGQHFLASEDLVQRMVRGARVEPGDRVVEVGPGLGILTRALLAAEADLTAVELDRDLAAYLRAELPDLRLVEADAARVDWRALCPDGGWKMVANLPYNVGTKVLMQALRCTDVFTSVTVMLQLEVVHRLMADPGSRTYGALSVEAQVRGRPVFLMGLGPEAFFPRPKVQSAVVRFDIHTTPQVGTVSPAFFDRVVRAGFAQRRKTLRNSLRSGFGSEAVTSALASAGVEPQARAEALGAETWRAVAAALAGSC